MNKRELDRKTVEIDVAENCRKCNGTGFIRISTPLYPGKKGLTFNKVSKALCECARVVNLKRRECNDKKTGYNPKD